ncbi:hypothetical protein NM688_g4666 [Phlebia brevispora]|uniref:Uncharacterized protein n=1 Tax=Phlebia brevispora TaxID=194682 RepID=A0ACC1T1Z9_9APHY|nr:hypothetical protein NM688_g4666 [Phlebia brevispora]
MASADVTGNSAQRAHLVDLVLQSEKALQQGQQLCSIARTRSVESAQIAVDVLALNAKVRWITDAVLEQLKVAASVAKIIERKRSQLDTQAKECDALRTKQTAALDAVLDSLGSQLVPAEFYSSSPESSLFGSQHNSDDEEEKPSGDPQPGQSPTETLRDVLRNGVARNWRARQKDRSTWKSLRDFVNERSIEDELDAIESDRNTLDDILARTSDYPESLSRSITAIRDGLPTEISIPPMDNIFADQEAVSVEMANHLSSLTSHYDQMVQALQECEMGEVFTEGDLQAMNRDTEELPAIIADLDKNMAAINASHNQLVSAKQAAQDQLDSHRGTLDDLDELGDTLASELGILSPSPPRLITTLKAVPPGTNGGVSFNGLLHSAGGGMLMGVTMGLSLLVESSQCRTEWRTALLPLLGWGSFAGLAGSLLDSLLGATVQRTKYSLKTKRILTDDGPAPGPDVPVRVISGLDILTNNQVDLLSEFVGIEDMNHAFSALNIKPVVDGVFPFDETATTYKYLESKEHVGKVVIRVASD